jgi:type III restriction enzyme
MESYEQFAENLQKEIEEDTGIRFGVVDPHQFAGIAVFLTDGNTAPLGVEQSNVLWEHLKATGYIDAKGKVQDSLKQALKDSTLTVPESFTAQLDQISAVLKKLAGRLEIKNADERRQVRTRQAVLHSPEFKALWDRIKYKTTFRVQFDNEKLIESCIRAVQEAPPIPKTRLQWRKADIAIGKAGVEATEREGAATVVLDEADIELPDLLTDLQDRTQLTRRSIQRILSGSRRLDDFKRNPQAFIELIAEVICRCKRLAVVDGIKYQRLGDEHYYAQELFEHEELTGYLRNLLDATKAVYEQVVYDSDTERSFADQLENNSSIKVYAKLPGWFTVPTPLGSYNPDWAVLVEKEGAEQLYFVVETKSSLFIDDLRDKESAKTNCGKAHFRALEIDENPAYFIPARDINDIFNRMI